MDKKALIRAFYLLSIAWTLYALNSSFRVNGHYFSMVLFRPEFSSVEIFVTLMIFVLAPILWIVVFGRGNQKTWFLLFCFSWIVSLFYLAFFDIINDRMGFIFGHNQIYSDGALGDVLWNGFFRGDLNPLIFGSAACIVSYFLLRRVENYSDLRPL